MPRNGGATHAVSRHRDYCGRDISAHADAIQVQASAISTGSKADALSGSGNRRDSRGVQQTRYAKGKDVISLRR